MNSRENHENHFAFNNTAISIVDDKNILVKNNKFQDLTLNQHNSTFYSTNQNSRNFVIPPAVQNLGEYGGNFATNYHTPVLQKSKMAKKWLKNG